MAVSERMGPKESLPSTLSAMRVEQTMEHEELRRQGWVGLGWFSTAVGVGVRVTHSTPTSTRAHMRSCRAVIFCARKIESAHHARSHHGHTYARTQVYACARAAPTQRDCPDMYIHM